MSAPATSSARPTSARRSSTTPTATRAMPRPRRSSRRSTRPTRSSPTTRSAGLRPVRPRRARGRRPRVRRDRRRLLPHAGPLRGDVLRAMRLRRRGARPRRGGDLRVQQRLTLREAAFGCKREVSVRAPARCDDCGGTGAKAGTKPETCPQCRGAGQVSNARGFVMFTTPCPRCRGAGRRRQARRARRAQGRARSSSARKVIVTLPGRASTAGQRLRVPGQGMPGPERRAAGRSLRRDRRRGRPALRARRGRSRDARATSRSPTRRSAREVRVPALEPDDEQTRRCRSTDPAGHAVGRGLHDEGARRPAARRSRARVARRRRAGRRADRAQRRARRAPRGARRRSSSARARADEARGRRPSSAPLPATVAQSMAARRRRAQGEARGDVRRCGATGRVLGVTGLSASLRDAGRARRRRRAREAARRAARVRGRRLRRGRGDRDAARRARRRRTGRRGRGDGRRRSTVRASDALLGRVVDGLGRPIDGGPPIDGGASCPSIAIRRAALDAPPGRRAARDRASACSTGCSRSARDSASACSRAPASARARCSARSRAAPTADVVVVALVGERGREVGEFLEHSLGAEGRSESVVVVATSDVAALERLRAAQVATAYAEYFRDQGRARHAPRRLGDALRARAARGRARRGRAAGAPRLSAERLRDAPAPARALRARARAGSITAIYTVLVEGGDMDEPIADEVRGILDGHVVLDRAIAARGRYPAVDVTVSLSRVMDAIVDAEHRDAARRLRALVAALRGEARSRHARRLRQGQRQGARRRDRPHAAHRGLPAAEHATTEVAAAFAERRVADARRRRQVSPPC